MLPVESHLECAAQRTCRQARGVADPGHTAAEVGLARQRALRDEGAALPDLLYSEAKSCATRAVKARPLVLS